MTEEEMFDALDNEPERAPVWKPEPGDRIVGTIRAFGKKTSQYGTHPTVLREEFQSQDPQVGDLVGIRYLGQPEGQKYHDYIVKVDHNNAEAPSEPVAPNAPF
ncbi:MAG: hypothetical protein IID37_07520 [Planctomycetes bacterium]|nr:hypothetical protein [Planctomycetota bacterium]